jgi:hypothetical protein
MQRPGLVCLSVQVADRLLPSGWPERLALMRAGEKGWVWGKLSFWWPASARQAAGSKRGRIYPDIIGGTETGMPLMSPHQRKSPWPVCLLLPLLALGAAVPLPAASPPLPVRDRLPGAPTEEGEEDADLRSARKLVEQLASEKFAERERASELLEAMGVTALKALRPAARSEDLETRRRAIRLIAAIKAGLPGVAQVRALGQVVNFGGIDDPKTTLIEAMELMSKTFNVSLDVNEQAFKKDGLKDPLNCQITESNPLPPMKAPLQTVLKKILARVPAPSGATYLLRKDSVEITTCAAIRRELKIEKGAELLPLVWEHFGEDPLVEVLDTLAEASGYNVVLDARVRGKARGTLVTARLLNVPVDTAVRVVADMAGLAVFRQNNVFYVTTPENVARLQKETLDRRGLPVRVEIYPPLLILP